MSREIKFRVKGITGDRLWLYINLPSIFNGGSIWYEGMDWKTLSQYTGLKDKNGKEVYQGDYLKVTADEEGYGTTSYGGIIEVTSETCGYSLKAVKPTLAEREANGQLWDSSSLWHVAETTNIEVIGNTTDNPELLKAAA